MVFAAENVIQITSIAEYFPIKKRGTGCFAHPCASLGCTDSMPYTWECQVFVHSKNSSKTNYCYE